MNERPRRPGTEADLDSWAQPSIEFDDDRVTLTDPLGDVEFARWDDLREVTVTTTRDAFPDEHYLYLASSVAGQGCAVPYSLMPEELFDRIKALPGFDEAALRMGLTTTGGRSVTCWQR